MLLSLTPLLPENGGIAFGNTSANSAAVRNALDKSLQHPNLGGYKVLLSCYIPFWILDYLTVIVSLNIRFGLS